MAKPRPRITRHPTRQAPPDTAEARADLAFPCTDVHLGALTQGPAVMIGRRPPPAAPKPGPLRDWLCHAEVAAQDTACRVVERAILTVCRSKTQLNSRNLRP